MAQEQHLYTPREAAVAIGVSYATIKKWILAGTLKTVRTPGGHHRIHESALAPFSASAKPQPVKKRIQSRERFRTTSGRNQLVGTIIEVKIRGILAQVVLAVGDSESPPSLPRMRRGRCSCAKGKRRRRS